MIQPPKEMGIEDFKYFIVVQDLMVAGVYAEDEENIYAVFVKGNAAPTGTVTSNTKDNITSQVEAGIAFIVKSPDEAMKFDISNAVHPKVIEFVENKKKKKK